jgi:carboxylesterase type B
MPAWPSYDPASRSTMVFDHQVEVVDDPLSSDRLAWSEALH